MEDEPMFQAPHIKRFTFWAVLGAGVLAGAAAASGHATSPPGVNNPRTNAGMASDAPDATLHDRPAAATPASLVDAGVAPSSSMHQEPAQKALSTPAGEALVFLDSPKGQSSAPEASAHDAVQPPTNNGSRYALLILLVMGLLGAAAVVGHFLKKGRASKSSMGPSLELVDSLRIAGKWHVSLVRAPGRLLVIGASEGEVSLLADLDEQEDVSSVLTDTLVDLPAAAQVPRPILAAAPEAETRPVQPAFQDAANAEDPFFDALLERMNARQPIFNPAVSIPAEPTPAVASAIESPGHEMAAIRARIAAYEQRNAHIA
jgi:flagellar biogenesis protein FliO